MSVCSNTFEEDTQFYRMVYTRLYTESGLSIRDYKCLYMHNEIIICFTNFPIAKASCTLYSLIKTLQSLFKQ
jgi:hypothetical protein